MSNGGNKGVVAAKEHIAYDGKLFLPESMDAKELDRIMDRVSELYDQYSDDGVFFDDVIWDIHVHILRGTFYNLSDVHGVQNILEVVYNEFIAN